MSDLDNQPVPPSYPIESVDNALRLLLMFREHATVGLAEASRTLGVARSTAHRLLAMLEFRGFVARDEESRAYRPGPALLEFGLAVVRGVDLRAIARPVIEALAAEVDETVHLGVLDGADVVFIDSVESAQVVRVGSRIGTRLPAHVTSLGKAILATLSPEQLQARYPSEEIVARTSQTIVRRSVLFAELEQVVVDGYSTNAGESEADVGAVGMAVLVGELGRAAISVSAPLARFDQATVELTLPHLRAATASLSSALP